MPPKPLPGFRDFYPEQFAERAHIFATWRRVVKRYAFDEYDGPPLEPLDLYTEKSGAEIVTQLYNFVDKGSRAVALRPEMTPTFARMVGARAHSLRKPVRWFSIPQLFRYERAQKGRLREHFQLNVDIVGEGDVLADAELLSVAIEIMRAFGLSSADVCARVSDRQLLNALLAHLGVPEAALPSVYAVLDKLERQASAQSAAALDALPLPLKVRDAVLRFGTLTFDELCATYGTAPLVAPHVARFRTYLAHADALGVADWIRFDLSIVRGLAYYTGIIFELFDRVGEFRAICGGGRYDTLLSSLAGVDLPALGFGLGDVVLGELLRARGLMPGFGANVDVWLLCAPDAREYPRPILQAASQLRSYGRSVEYALRPQRLERQLESARKAGARVAVTITEVEDGPAVFDTRLLNDARDRGRQFIDLDALNDWLSEQPTTTS